MCSRDMTRVVGTNVDLNDHILTRVRHGILDNMEMV